MHIPWKNPCVSCKHVSSWMIVFAIRVSKFWTGWNVGTRPICLYLCIFLRIKYFDYDISLTTLGNRVTLEATIYYADVQSMVPNNIHFEGEKNGQFCYKITQTLMRVFIIVDLCKTQIMILEEEYGNTPMFSNFAHALPLHPAFT